MVGAQPDRVHTSDLVESPTLLRSYRVLAFPGGFSFGDHLGSGKVHALIFKRHLRAELDRFVMEGGLVLGICNGFQVLVKLGLLPNLSGERRQEASLIANESGKFEDRWVRLTFDPASPCVWTRGLADMDLQVRHGEGRFTVGSVDILEELERRHMAAARYVSRTGGVAAYPDNPNGAVHGIAGICDPTGRVFGLMPHPEAYLFEETHPDWSRTPRGAEHRAQGGLPPGVRLIQTGVKAAE